MFSNFHDSNINPMVSLSPLFDPFLIDEDICHLFGDHHHHSLQPHDTSVLNNNTGGTLTESEIYNSMEACNNNNASTMSKDSGMPSWKRSKPDSTFKVMTAQGPMSCRMRLSLDVAPMLFMVHEMLGFHKVSKTVEWLLTNSKAAIDQLSTSESEVVSKLKESGIYMQKAEVSGEKFRPNRGKERKARPARRAAFKHLSKESRNKARERARERTMGKSKNNRNSGFH